MQPFAADLAGTPQIDSPAFWAQPFRVPASSDPDTATAQTILIMSGHVRKAAVDPLVVESARRAVGQFGGLGVRRFGTSTGVSGAGSVDASAIAGAAWWWCKVFVKFKHHGKLIRQWLGEDGELRGFEPGQFGLQGLITPDVLVRMDKPQGDCAIFSECLAAFLTVYGIPYEFVTAAVNPSEPDVFSHVFLYAVLPDGSRLPLDASHGQYPGWQVPSAHVSRRQVWDSDGNPVADRGSRFDGLHNYGLRGMGASGVDPLSGESWGSDDPVDTGYTAPSQSSDAWANFASQMGKMGFNYLQIKAIQPGTVVSKDGSILRQNPGYAVGSPTMSANLGISTTTLMVGGLALVAVLFMSMKGGR